MDNMQDGHNPNIHHGLPCGIILCSSHHLPVTEQIETLKNAKNIGTFTGLDNCIVEVHNKTLKGQTTGYEFTNAGDNYYFCIYIKVSSTLGFGILFTQSIGGPRIFKYAGGAVSYTMLATS